MRYKKEDLEKMILTDKLSYREIGRKYNVSDTSIKGAAIKLGICLPKRRTFPENFLPYNKGKGKKIICKNCGNVIPQKKWRKQEFCDRNCYSNFKIKHYYEYYLSHQDKFVGKILQLNFVKKHILKEQNNKCKICDCDNIWNDKILIFVLDHEDGDAANNKRKNLRLVCPNCNSQLDTFTSKNKNSARKERYLKYENRKIYSKNINTPT